MWEERGDTTTLVSSMVWGHNWKLKTVSSGHPFIIESIIFGQWWRSRHHLRSIFINILMITASWIYSCCLKEDGDSKSSSPLGLRSFTPLVYFHWWVLVLKYQLVQIFPPQEHQRYDCSTSATMISACFSKTHSDDLQHTISSILYTLVKRYFTHLAS